ncbi:MAG: ankyrin repeat domain-containing protein [Anaerolineaceae bacterium]|nr:ankyrin repeat domain-containing protein [Anaerolineaceae bacterium]MCY4022485.1 ankyrin repeat domain-containing protein [Anaerolineaceae bacterium]
MRSGLLLPVLLLLLVTSAVQAQELEPAWLEVANVALRLREGPSTDDDIITQLTPREAVQLLQRGEQWSHIRRQDGQSGWAHNDYLLPWDERNRPDSRRRVGEQRLFRVFGQLRHGELRAVSDHSYVYTLARRADSELPAEEALQDFGRDFDTRIYQQALDLWGVDDPPDTGGEERIVILLAAGFDADENPPGWYSGRYGLPREQVPAGSGYLGIRLRQDELPNVAMLSLPADFLLLAHQFGHLLHDYVGGHNRATWVQEGLATFTAQFLASQHGLYGERDAPAIGTRAQALTQLNAGDSDYPGHLFITYLYERLGIETWRDFAAHRQQGLAALDDLLADRDGVTDADAFFADWVLANHLNDGRRADGRFGYGSLQAGAQRALPAPSHRIQKLPAGIRDAAPPYAARYYELPLWRAVSATDRLLLDFRLAAPFPQDAWLQFVQVLPDSIDVQRYRASDYRNQPVLASLREGTERVFVAVSPFTPGRRRHTRPAHYSLAMRSLSSLPDNKAQVTAILNQRSEAEIADNIIGKLQRCTYVKVLQRDEEWSLVLGDGDQPGWSHNDYLFHGAAPAPGGRANPCTALMRAAHDGNLATVRYLLASGADVNGQDAWGRSALHEAAFWGHERVIASLLRAGADIHLQDLGGRSALDDVVLSRDADSFLLLHRADPAVDVGDPVFRPLMIDAAAAGNHEALELFLSAGHDINWRDDAGRTALAAAADNGRTTTLRRLIEAGADPQLADRAGRTPLMLAAAGGRLEVLGPLLDAGAKVNIQDLQGHNALTLAAARGHSMSVARLLLSEEVDVHHSLSDSGRNALHLAAADGHADIIAMLRLAGLDPSAQDTGGHSALQLAGAAGHDQAADYLRLPASWTPVPFSKLSPRERDAFLAAAQRGDLAEVERFLAAGAQLLLISHDEEGWTALMQAARAGHRDVVLRLLLAGAHPDVRFNTGRDEPALFFTIREGYDDLTAMLLLADAWPGAGRSLVPDNHVALYWAARYGRADLVHLLLGLHGPRQIRVNYRFRSGWTALFPAVWRNHPDIVRTLLAAGADPNVRPYPYIRAFYSGSIRSVLDAARRRGNREIIDMLLAAGAEA